MVRRCVVQSAVGVLVALLLRVGSASAEIVVEVGTVEASPGAVAQLPVTLHTDGEPLVGFQNDLIFDPAIAPLARDELRAACSQNPDLLPGDLGVRSFLLGVSCAGDGQCIRSMARLSSEVFPPGSAVVYTCAVQVAPDAAAGSHAVRCAEFETTNRAGERLPGTCTDGAIVVGGDPANATPTALPTPTPLPQSSGPAVLALSSLSGAPGDRLTVDLRLRSGEVPIAGLQADMTFPPVARIAAQADGNPECVFGSEPNLAGYSGVAFQPPGCRSDDCTGMRVLIITTELVAIPDDTLLLSCSVDIAPDAPEEVYAFALSALEASTEDGIAQPLEGDPGTLTVSGTPVATPTTDPDSPRESTATPTSIPAAPAPTFTANLQLPQRSHGVPQSSGGATSTMSSGCAIAPQQGASGAWEILLVAGLLALRRRR